MARVSHFRLDLIEWKVTLAKDDERERLAYDQLKRLLKKYKLSKWIITRTICIDSNAVPHSHPVLTVNSRHLDDDGIMLAVFLHEQIHWFLADHIEEVNSVIAKLQLAFPNVPTRPPRGANGKFSTYLHIIVNYLEYRTLSTILGPTSAKLIVEKQAETHYSWIYGAVIRHRLRIDSLIRKVSPRILRELSASVVSLRQQKHR